LRPEFHFSGVLVGLSLHMAATDQHPLDLILARNLMTVLDVPAFLVDQDGAMVFFNECAGQMLGKSFEEIGKLNKDAEGREVHDQKMPLAVALREGRPAHGRFHICTDQDRIVEVESSALPLNSGGGFHGAMVMFWPVKQ
jgi:PAS domain-containing protein